MASRIVPRATRSLLVCVLIGVVAGVLVGTESQASVGILTGIALTHTIFVAHGWITLWKITPAEMERHVAAEVLPKIIDEVVVVLIAVGGLVGILVLLLVQGSHTRQLGAGIALIAVFTSWGSLHLMYAARYADLYYRGSGGIDFNNGSDPPPTYREFLYFSYNLGMTYQVSDTSVSSNAIRSVVLRQCLLSYLFGVAILATTLNLVSNIVF